MTKITFENGKAVMRNGNIDARGLPCGCCECDPSSSSPAHGGLQFEVDYLITISSNPLTDCAEQTLEGTLTISDWDSFLKYYSGSVTIGEFRIEAYLGITFPGVWYFQILLEVDTAVCCPHLAGMVCASNRYGPENHVKGCSACDTCFPPEFIALDEENNVDGGIEWPDGNGGGTGITIEGLCTRLS
jgi:hypothetical protein